MFNAHCTTDQQLPIGWPTYYHVCRNSFCSILWKP